MYCNFSGKYILRIIILLFLIQIQVQAQELITGKIFDSSDGESLPGVNITVKGTTIGGSTNSEGEFSFRVPNLRDTLVVSFIGYETQEVPINGRIFFSLALVREVIVGEEIVALGYSDQRQRDITGAISTVSSGELKGIGRTSVNQLLIGRAAGLNLQTRSAQPGGGVNVNIRGAISPNGNNTPLYVIDGVPITNNSSSVAGLNDGVLGFFGGVDRDPLSYLNPNDIESISILKDASATAIYGSSAANGVILITTKNGSASDVQVNYSGSLTTQRTREYFPILNGNEFMFEQNRLAFDRYLYDNNLAPYGNVDASSVPGYQPLFSEQEIQNGVTGTDWFDLIFRDGQINEHNLSISGGNDRTKVYTSFNFQENEAVLEKSSLSRYSGRLNIQQSLSSVVSLNVKSTVSRLIGSNSSTGGNSGGSEKFNLIQAANAYSPVIEVLDESGNFNPTYNPLIMSPAAFLEITDRTETMKIFAAPEVEVRLTPSIQLTGIAQVDIESTNRNFYLPRITNNTQLPDGMAQKSENTIENYSAETYLTYRTSFYNGDLNVVFGGGYYETSSNGFSLQAVGFFTDAFRDNNVGVASELLQNTVDSYRNGRTKVSQFFRANYNLKDRYIISVVARRDGSSIFSENNQYGIFPGVSLAWILTEENFLSDIEKLSSLKLRLGYGQSGNESILRGNTLELYSPGYPFLIGQTEFNGIALSQVANPNLSWETITTVNLGLDFGVFANRVIGKFDIYQRTANDLLDFNVLPSNNAVGIIADNVGATRSEGFELELTTSNIQNNRFNWYTNFNISYNKSYWHERNPRVALASFIGENDELGTIYGWKTDGIIKLEDDIPAHMPDANLGNIIYKDINNDGRLDSEDVVKLGNSVPRWRVGFGNDFSYKNLDFSIYMYGSLDFQIYNNYAPNIFSISQSTNPSNTTNLIREAWSANNTKGTRPGIAPNPYDGSNPASNDFNLENGNFIRVSNINVGYTIPSNVLRGVRLARIFISMQDIALLTNYSGFDPEFSEPNPYPASYSTTLGIDINF